MSWYLLKASRTHLVLAVALFVFGLPTALSVFTSERPAARSIPFIVTKEQAEKYLSAALSVSLLLYVTLKSRTRFVAITREADREILLTCPVSLSEYFAAQTIYSTLTTFAYSVYWINIAYTVNSGNLAKALYLPLLITLVAAATNLLFRNLEFILLHSDCQKPLTAALVYLALSVLHSMALMEPSPLLTLPTGWVARPIVLCFTITEPFEQVLIESAPIYVVTVLLLLAQARAVRLVHPEHLKLPVEASTQPEEEEAGQPLYGKPDAVIYGLVLWKPLLSKRHAVALFIGLAASILAGNILRMLLRAGDGLSMLPPFVAVLSGVLFPIVSAMAVSTIQFHIAPIWVYRVYGGSFKAIVNALLLRLTIYMLELSACLALFNLFLTGKYEYLLVPIAALPAAEGSAAAILLAVAYLLPRRRLVRHVERLTTLEESVLLIIMGGATVFAVPLMIFVVLLGSGAPWLPVFSAVSLALAALMHYLSVELISEILRTRDIAS
ncbi:MAG: hypothetical protein QXT93_07285 [Thermofilum sp.]